MVAVDDWTVATNPAPAVGGVTMVAMLLLMKAYALEQWDEPALRRFAQVQRAVMEYRKERLDHHDHRTEHVFELLALARAGDAGALLSSPSTIHASAVDADGTAVAITLSAGYGSGGMIPGSGFWMNNSLGEVELIAEGFHALEPGTRLSSNMAPTVARRPDGSVLAIGSPGADRITTAIASVLINHLHLGMSLDEAIIHPRMHIELRADAPTMAFEPGLAVTPFGDVGVRPYDSTSMFFGGVTAAEWSPLGDVSGAADARRSGGVAIGGTGV